MEDIMNDNIRFHLSEIHRFEKPDNEYMRVHVDFFRHHEDDDKLWNCNLSFMLKETGSSLVEIENDAFAKAKNIFNDALEAFDEKE